MIYAFMFLSVLTSHTVVAEDISNYVETIRKFFESHNISVEDMDLQQSPPIFANVTPPTTTTTTTTTITPPLENLTETSEDVNDRKFFQWLKNMSHWFGRTPSTSKPANFWKTFWGRREFVGDVTPPLEVILSELVKILHELNDKIRGICTNKDKVYILNAWSADVNTTRSKRSINNDSTDSNNVRSLQTTTEEAEINAKTTMTADKLTTMNDLANITAGTEKNESNITNADANKVNITVSGRRYNQPMTDVKRKLYQYIDENFQFIHDKVAALKSVRDGFSESDSYRIGYIVANIDTLDMNLKSLRLDMEVNKEHWDEEQILNLYDRLKTSVNVVTELLDGLKYYVNKDQETNIGIDY